MNNDLKDNTLTDFIIPNNGEEIKSIVYIEHKFRPENRHQAESKQSSLPEPEEIGSCLKACPNLEELVLYWDSGRVINTPPDEIFGEIIATIAVYGNNLTSLSISSNSLLDEHLKHLNQKSFPFLRDLSLPGCYRLGASGLEYALSGCPNITNLDLHYSLYKEANEAAKLIGKHLSELRRLNMHRTCHMLDDGLAAIAEGCSHIEQMEIGRNYQLTDEALKKLSEHCNDLQLLGMYYNKKVSERGLEYILKGCHNFKCFHHGRGWCQIEGVKSVEMKYPQVCFSREKSFCVERK